MSDPLVELTVIGTITLWLQKLLSVNNGTAQNFHMNMKASATEGLGYKLKHHKPWFGEKVLKIIRSKEAG
jgi:hypothetical protein